MDADEVATLASMLWGAYAPVALDPGVTEPTILESADGSRARVLPREQREEPFRSLHLLGSTAVGATLVVTFSWIDGSDDGTIFLMPLDARGLELDLDDSVAVTTFLMQHIEFTLGGARDTWEPRTSLLSPRFAVVRPWTAG